jgi:hypothetical protein
VLWYPGHGQSGATRDGSNISAFCVLGAVLGLGSFPHKWSPQLSPFCLSVPLEGKNQVWQYDVIPILVDLLKDPEKEVQANAAGALMFATVTTEGEVERPCQYP